MVGTIDVGTNADTRTNIDGVTYVGDNSRLSGDFKGNAVTASIHDLQSVYSTTFSGVPTKVISQKCRDLEE